MYKNGEIEKVMTQFETSLAKMPVYIGGNKERADKVQVELDGGRTSSRYANNNYYNNGSVNQMFIMYLHGYSFGKCSANEDI